MAHKPPIEMGGIGDDEGKLRGPKPLNQQPKDELAQLISKLGQEGKKTDNTRNALFEKIQADPENIRPVIGQLLGSPNDDAKYQMFRLFENVIESGIPAWEILADSMIENLGILGPNTLNNRTYLVLSSFWKATPDIRFKLQKKLEAAKSDSQHTMRESDAIDLMRSFSMPSEKSIEVLKNSAVQPIESGKLVSAVDHVTHETLDLLSVGNIHEAAALAIKVTPYLVKILEDQVGPNFQKKVEFLPRPDISAARGYFSSVAEKSPGIVIDALSMHCKVITSEKGDYSASVGDYLLTKKIPEKVPDFVDHLAERTILDVNKLTSPHLVINNRPKTMNILVMSVLRRFGVQAVDPLLRQLEKTEDDMEEMAINSTIKSIGEPAIDKILAYTDSPDIEKRRKGLKLLTNPSLFESPKPEILSKAAFHRLMTESMGIDDDGIKEIVSKIEELANPN